MGTVETARYFIVSASPGVGAMLLADVLLDPATRTVEWSLRPIHGRGDPETHRAVVDLTDAAQCEAGAGELIRFLASHLRPDASAPRGHGGAVSPRSAP